MRRDDKSMVRVLLASVAAGGALVGALSIGAPDANATECGLYAGDIYCSDDLPTLATCAYEDGNPNGLPCIWTNAGTRYWVTSENYR